MHANVQWRHDPATGEEAPYYRLKESYREYAERYWRQMITDGQIDRFAPESRFCC